jgi:hypothetical protein
VVSGHSSGRQRERQRQRYELISFKRKPRRLGQGCLPQPARFLVFAPNRT